MRTIEGGELHPSKDARGINWFEPVEVELVAQTVEITGRCFQPGTTEVALGGGSTAAESANLNLQLELTEQQLALANQRTQQESERANHNGYAAGKQRRSNRRLVSDIELGLELLAQHVDGTEPIVALAAHKLDQRLRELRLLLG